MADPNERPPRSDCPSNDVILMDQDARDEKLHGPEKDAAATPQPHDINRTPARTARFSRSRRSRNLLSGVVLRLEASAGTSSLARIRGRLDGLGTFWTRVVPKVANLSLVWIARNLIDTTSGQICIGVWRVCFSV